MRTLHLVLKSKWFDKIASGEKTSEYRECKPYWNKRLIGTPYVPCLGNKEQNETLYCLYDHVCFHRGYTAETMLFPIRSLYITTKANDLNLDKCWEIKLGQRIK